VGERIARGRGIADRRQGDARQPVDLDGVVGAVATGVERRHQQVARRGVVRLGHRPARLCERVVSPRDSFHHQNHGEDDASDHARETTIRPDWQIRTWLTAFGSSAVGACQAM